MIKAGDLFSSLTKSDVDIHVQLDDDSKYVVREREQLHSSLSHEDHWMPKMCFAYQV
jgi:hypothetical protein